MVNITFNDVFACSLLLVICCWVIVGFCSYLTNYFPILLVFQDSENYWTWQDRQKFLTSY